MNCREAEKRIYLYRELSEKEQRELDQHVITCKSCQQVMQGMRHVEALLRKSIEVNPQPKNPQLLTQRILTSIKKKEKHAGFSELLDYLDSYFTKYAFAALSIILVTFFINEYSREEVILQQNLARKQNGPTLNTAALHEKFQQRRQHKEDQPISLYAYYKKLYTDKSI